MPPIFAGRDVIDFRPRVRQARAILYTIPDPPGDFIGRSRDLDLLLQTGPGAGAHLTGLKGMGGIGKTALACVLARAWAPRFPDARLLLDGRGTQPDPPSAAALLIRGHHHLPSRRRPEPSRRRSRPQGHLPRRARREKGAPPPR